MLRRPRKGDVAPRIVEKLKRPRKSATYALAALLSALVLEVAFQQHMGGNRIPRCSKCYFVIAWAAERVANSSCDGWGAFPKSLSVNSQGDTRGMTGW